MRSRWIALGALAVALGCARGYGADVAAAQREADRLAQGRAEFETYCASCHGSEGDGNGPVAPSMTPRPADLRRIAARNGGAFPQAAIEAWVDGRDAVAAHGPRDMPVWGRAFREEEELNAVTEERVRDRIVLLVHYLESIQQP